MSRLNKADEIIELAILLQNSHQGLTIEQMMESMERPKRSIERMKALLVEKFGDKLEEMDSINNKKKRWRLKKGTINSLISFTTSEFANLEQLKALLNDKNKQREIDGLIAKIKTLTSQKNLTALDTDIEALVCSQSYAVRQYPHEKIDLNLVNKIQECILAFKKLKVVYKIQNKDYEIKLHPYGFLFFEYSYLVAIEDEDNKPKIYKLSRIKKAEISNEYFEKNEDFDLKQYSQKSFGLYNSTPMNVELLFSNEVKDDVLNYHFHPTQKMEIQEDNSIKVSFQASGEYEICRNLFKWSDTVKILAPQNLKEFYKKELEKILINSLTI